MSLPGISDDPAKGDVGAVQSFASTFTTRSTEAVSRQSETTGALGALEPVTADSADALRPRITMLGQRFGETSVGADAVAAILTTYATELDSLKTQATSALARAQSAYDMIWVRRREALNAASEFVTGWALGWDDVLPSWMYLDDPGYLRRWSAAIDDYRTARTLYNNLQATRDDLDRRTASDLRNVPFVTEITRGGAVSLSGFAAAAALWADDVTAITAESLAGLEDPELIRQVWESMDDDQRDALITAAPLIIGNLNGIPIRDRVTANRINIDNEIQARRDEIARLEQLRDEAVAGAYHSQDAIAAQYDKLIAEEQRQIDYYDSLLTQQVDWYDQDGRLHTDDGARVVVFDPRIQAIATYHGPIDPQTGDIPSWVRNVAVSVPGTGSNMTNFSDGRGRDLYEAAGYDTAIFQWSGGEFPQDIPAAMDPSYSHALAPRLRDFAGGIAVPTGANLTVLGHSYGGATVGLAEQAGLRADRILYVSAAGMGDGVSGLDDFPNTSDVPHYALMSRNDMVVGLIQGSEGDFHALHGQSSLTADGVTRLETGWIDGADPSSDNIENYNVPDNGMPSAIDSHSSVYTPGSTAFNNIVTVITGGDAVAYAPGETIVAGRSVVTIDGIDLPDYRPEYVRIE